MQIFIAGTVKIEISNENTTDRYFLPSYELHGNCILYS